MTQTSDPNTEVSQLKRALLALKEMRARLESIEQARSEPVAVIGMGCRFPGGADSPDRLWQLMMDGVDAISDVPPDRWQVEEIYDPDFMAPGKANTRWAGFIDRVDEFDPAFFGISPREAVHMDPQQRILLQVAYEALENAGQPLEALEGSLTGVYVGVLSHSSDYAFMQMRDLTDIDTHTGAGTAHSIIANRLSYLFDFQGPSIALDTACSSSLVAAHLAVQSLRQHECNLALAAGVNLFLTPESTVTFSKLQMMALDGRCKTFDACADGFVRGEGCGVLVLKRLSDALADGDRILALVQGTAVNQDGRTNGLTAPNGLAQQKVIRQALANARVSPEKISYVETHGTGTKLGDPIEVEALAEVIGKPGPDSPPCYIGSVKTNVGHLEAAAGIVGLIKTVLVLHHGMIPPHLHLQKLNPLIQLENTRFKIATTPQPYPRSDAMPRLAGVSSFGFGGTNAHVILREAPAIPDQQSASASAPYLLPLSARSDTSLHDLAGAFQEFLASTPASLTDILYTAAKRRTRHAKRLALVGSSAEDLIEKLEAFRANNSHADVAQGQAMPASERGLAFVFSGQGPQWPGMGRELMQSEPVFRAKIEEIEALLRQYVDWPLADELRKPEGESRLNETEVAQPAIFAMQVALAALWKSWGITPEAVVGHSIGEIAAAHIAGVLSLEDAVRVVYHRSRLMQRVTGLGKMAAVGLPQEEVDALLSSYSGLSLGAVNSPVSSVLSGDGEALGEIVTSLSAKGTFARMLPVNYAFHSPVMDSLMPELEDALRGLAPQPANIALYSTVRGARAAAGDYDAAYWARNIRRPVLFAQAVKAMLESGCNTFVEVSPHPVLSESVRQSLDGNVDALIVPTLRRSQPERGVMMRGLGALFTRGYAINWDALVRGGRLVDLPNYPWQNARYWLPNSAYRVETRVRPRPAEQQESQAPDWLYDLVWQPLELAAENTAEGTPGSWLVLADAGELGSALAQQFDKLGQNCDVIAAGNPSGIGDWLRSANNPRGVIDLRACELSDPLQDAACASALESVKTLLSCEGGNTPRLWLVTRAVHSVDGEKILPPAANQSLLWGLGRTVGLENPEIWGGLIDLDQSDTAELAQAVASIVTAPGGEDQVAVRQGKCFGLRMQRAEQPPAVMPELSGDGAYLITGGLGGLGLQLARWLFEHGARHIVLTSRTGLPRPADRDAIDPESALGKRIAAVRALEAGGAAVTVVAADVADEMQMLVLMSSFGKTLPPLRGVIHAAGVVSTQTAAGMDLDTLRAVLKPKVTGAWILHRLTQDQQLDFFVVFSSSAAVLGSHGLGHYAAANAYLDTFAAVRRGMDLPTLSVNWGWWAGAGMATAQIEEQFQQIGQRAMPVKDALQALGALISSGETHKMVASIDWERFKPIYEARRKRPLVEHMHAEAHPQPEQVKEEATFIEQLLSMPAGKRFDGLKAHVRKQVGQVLGFSESDTIDPNQGFFTIGMDSVMAVQLSSRLSASLGKTLPATLAFEYPTIQALTTCLADDVLKLNVIAQPAAAAEPQPVEPPEPKKTLSEDELLSKLDDELAAFTRFADGD